MKEGGTKHERQQRALLNFLKNNRRSHHVGITRSSLLRWIGVTDKPNKVEDVKNKFPVRFIQIPDEKALCSEVEDDSDQSCDSYSYVTWLSEMYEGHICDSSNQVALDKNKDILVEYPYCIAEYSNKKAAFASVEFLAGMEAFFQVMDQP